MSNIYVISDIHGYYEQMVDSLKNVDLKNQENTILFLGDFVDGGRDSCKVLYYIKGLFERRPEQTTVLLGNHDEMFLDWLYSKIDELQWLSQDKSMRTVKSFFTLEEYREVLDRIQSTSGSYDEISNLFKAAIKKKHHDLLEWFQTIYNQPRYLETARQIFVHAGILEEAGDLWKHGTPQEYFTNKYPAEVGFFIKILLQVIFQVPR
ncbi:metallophosphoesterase [Bacillus sp. JCM 19034]|uniref:metallophosphoesterase n=1 Tax=Bacillus sp. JCM 19034 TaxID=1481928 RepID=UPI000B2F63F0|nr:metallophosphoesterase [Bacillus sp. JCM 19034]